MINWTVSSTDKFGIINVGMLRKTFFREDLPEVGDILYNEKNETYTVHNRVFDYFNNVCILGLLFRPPNG